MDPITTVLLIGCVFSSFIAIQSNLKHILIFLKGKKLAVLGDKGTGKTTLLNYLIKKVLSEGYHQTRYAKKTDEQRFCLDEDTWISLKKSTDLGGDTSFHSQWESLFKESDLIFYMVRADLLMKNDEDTKDRVKMDLDLIQGWRKSYDPENRKNLLIICTFCDQIDNMKKNIPRMIGNDELHKFFPLLVKHGIGIRVALGSLLTKDNNDNTEKLVKLVFKEIQSKCYNYHILFNLLIIKRLILLK